MYLFKDYFSNAAALSMVGFVQTVLAFIAIPLVKPLVARFGKKEIAVSWYGASSNCVFCFILLTRFNCYAIYFVAAIGMFGFAFFNLVVWAFVTDVIDYHEYLTGLREDATVYSIYSFARKVGQAIAGGLGGIAIAAVGYNATRAHKQQEALNGIHTLATLVPAIIYIVIFLILVFLYPLTKNVQTSFHLI